MVHIAEAVGQAVKVYEKMIARDGTDPAYFPIEIKVRLLDATFEQTLAEMIFRDKEDG